MGVSCTVYQVTEAQLDEITASPARMIELHEHGPNDAPDRSCSVDRAWQAIDYLLNACLAPESFYRDLLGEAGRPLVGTDNGYGDARAFDAESVRFIAQDLQAVTTELLLATYDQVREDMNECAIFPGTSSNWPPRNADGRGDLIDYVVENYEPLRAFVLQAAERGGVLVVAMS